MPGERLKIVVFGSFNAGKSTFIQTLDPESHHVEADIVGGTTTVAIDFGRVRIGERLIYLFGTPGQERFEFVREIVSRGMDGAVIMIDTTAALDSFTGQICQTLREEEIPRIVLLNKCDCNEARPEQIKTAVGPEDILCISALSHEEASLALERLVALIPFRPGICESPT
jgi:small GTP-binding protein